MKRTLGWRPTSVNRTTNRPSAPRPPPFGVGHRIRGLSPTGGSNAGIRRYDAARVSDRKTQPAAPVRLDKWLWAARFFKTRSLASQSIAAGHVKIAGDRAKAAHAVRIGDEISIAIGPYVHVVGVRAISAIRRGAPEARLLYEETPASLAAREALAAMLKADRSAFEPAAARPSKRDRRAIDRLRGR